MSCTSIFRTDWPESFFDVFIHTQLDQRDNHPAYKAAKSGDADAGMLLAKDLLSPETTEKIIKTLYGRHAILTAVTALETTGFNAIPDCMAHLLASQLELPVESTLIQSNKVGHTRAKGWHRFVTPALFEGTIEKGANYILVDDHIGHGGTLANMRGYIEAHGGHVILMTTLTETREARKIALQNTTLTMLRSKHGTELEQFWRALFGYGLDCLTELEGAYLYRQPSFDAIREAMAVAAKEADCRGLSAIQIPER